MWTTAVKVFDRYQAEINAALLRGAGIPVRVVSDSVGGWIPELVTLRGAEVQVPSDRVDEALELLAAPPEYQDQG